MVAALPALQSALVCSMLIDEEDEEAKAEAEVAEEEAEEDEEADAEPVLLAHTSSPAPTMVSVRRKVPRGDHGGGSGRIEAATVSKRERESQIKIECT